MRREGGGWVGAGLAPGGAGLRTAATAAAGEGARRAGHVVGVSRDGRGGTAGRAAPLEAAGDGGAGNGARAGWGRGGSGRRPEEGLRAQYEAGAVPEPLRVGGAAFHAAPRSAEFRLPRPRVAPRLPEPLLGSRVRPFGAGCPAGLRLLQASAASRGRSAHCGHPAAPRLSPPPPCSVSPGPARPFRSRALLAELAGTAPRPACD